MCCILDYLSVAVGDDARFTNSRMAIEGMMMAPKLGSRQNEQHNILYNIAMVDLVWQPRAQTNQGRGNTALYCVYCRYSFLTNPTVRRA